MPNELSVTVVNEKNRLSNPDSVFLCALEITIPGTDEPARVVLNTENITWRGEVWQAVIFEIEGLKASSTNEVPQVTARVSNVNRVMEKYIQDYDTHCKLNGYEPIDVTIYELNTADLANDSPCVDHVFTLKQPSLDQNWATFLLSASNPANRRAPFNAIRKNFCSYRFMDLRCGYMGLATSCKKTLTACRELGNSRRFGGAPGAGKTGLTLGAGA
jgi:phage-related protein